MHCLSPRPPTSHLPMLLGKGESLTSRCTHSVPSSSEPDAAATSNRIDFSQQPSEAGTIISTSRFKKARLRPHSQGADAAVRTKVGPRIRSPSGLKGNTPSGYPRASPKVPSRPVPAWLPSCSWERVKSPDAHLERGPGTCAFNHPTSVSMHSQV